METTTSPGACFVIPQVGEYLAPTWSQKVGLALATISVNGHVVGSVQVDADGAFTFTLTTPLAGEGIYWVKASVNPSANTRFVLDSAAETRPKEGDLTPLEVPAGIAFSSELFLPTCAGRV